MAVMEEEGIGCLDWVLLDWCKKSERGMLRWMIESPDVGRAVLIANKSRKLGIIPHRRRAHGVAECRLRAAGEEVLKENWVGVNREKEFLNLTRMTNLGIHSQMPRSSVKRSS